MQKFFSQHFGNEAIYIRALLDICWLSTWVFSGIVMNKSTV